MLQPALKEIADMLVIERIKNGSSNLAVFDQVEIAQQSKLV